MRLCPVCESDKTSAGFTGRSTGHAGREDYATASCHECGSLWDEVFYRRTAETVNSNIRRGALKGISHRQHDNQDAGCPICGAIHIAVNPNGPMAANCACVDCGATWDQRYQNGHAYRSNIKAPEMA